jgi:hypothetical protein
MAKAQETRRANLAIKKAAKEAAAREAAAALAGESFSAAPADQVKLATPLAAAKVPSPKQQKSGKQKNLPEATRPASTRVRKPTRIAAGLDGVAGEFEDENGNENEDELDQQFQSEYDHYQALTTAGSPVLGKRTRKPVFDLAAIMGETSEEEYI